MSREEPAYLVRYEIIRTARTLFQSKGFDETSLEEIVDGLKCTERAFFAFFRSKDDLLEAVWSEV